MNDVKCNNSMPIGTKKERRANQERKSKKYKIIRENLPGNFTALLENGWRIVPCSCECGGEWAWLNENNRMHGCVCHRTPREDKKKL